MSRRRRSRGFTLIEVMMAAGILGMLATVAMPMVSRATLRSKSTERSYMIRAIHDGIEDTYRTAGRFPTDRNTVLVSGAQNPAGTIGPNKRVFDSAMQNWSQLNLRIEGGLYYSYFFFAGEGAGLTPFAMVWAEGDLDGDGVHSFKYVQYNRDTGVYRQAWASPVDGMDDDRTYGSF
jgi:prepilin-type N-terminal cleavage/methylation domain-containing protein